MQPETILIIEDNELNLQLATDLLEASGFTVHQARTAEEGVQLARQVFPKLILMDWSLPGMDGLHATSILKTHPATRQLPVIALTAHAMKGDEEIARQAGCDGYLTKPIDTRSFVREIKNFITAAYPLKQTA